MKSLLYILVMGLCLPLFAQERTTITFQAPDGVVITADLMNPLPVSAPLIILCHQAGWSRGEYQEIMPKLNDLGYNCMAIDQRSGGAVNSVTNETNQDAQRKMKQTRYLDAIPDIKAAIAYAQQDSLTETGIILWGSSYSAALSLVVAADTGQELLGVLAFSPGEYFSSQGKSREYIKTAASAIKIPAFITSARNEQKSWQAIYEAIPTEGKQSYLPTTSGNHGSRALWSQFPDSRGYWEAVTQFLQSL